MSNMLFVILLLFNYVQLIMSAIANEELPVPFAECKEKEYEPRHQCVMDIYSKGTDWMSSDDDVIQLTLQQTFYWHPTKRVRRECRTLSKRERNELWDAVNALKKDTVSCFYYSSCFL